MRLVRRRGPQRQRVILTLHRAHLHQQDFIIACNLNESDWVLWSPRYKGRAPFKIQADGKGTSAGGDASDALVCDILRSYVMELSTWSGERSPVIRREGVRIPWWTHLFSGTGQCLVCLQQEVCWVSGGTTLAARTRLRVSRICIRS